MNHAGCRDNKIDEVISPDGKFVAVSFQRSCGHEPRMYTWVRLAETESGGSDPQPVVTIEGAHQIKVTWASPTNLEIKSSGFRNPKSVMTQDDSWKTVTITYRAN